jgi:hypothetical protein
MAGPTLEAQPIAPGATTTAVAPLDDSTLRRRLDRAGKGMSGGIGLALFIPFWAEKTISDVRKLELGTVDQVRVWNPAALLYRLFGMPGLVASFVLLFALAVGIAWSGLKERRDLVLTVGKARVAKLDPTWVTRREMRLFLVMVLLGLGAALYIWTQIR